MPSLTNPLSQQPHTNASQLLLIHCGRAALFPGEHLLKWGGAWKGGVTEGERGGDEEGEEGRGGGWKGERKGGGGGKEGGGRRGGKEEGEEGGDEGRKGVWRESGEKREGKSWLSPIPAAFGLVSSKRKETP